jgi:hypothetical protein
LQFQTTIPPSADIPIHSASSAAVTSATEWEMYKKILNLNSSQASGGGGGLNKAENATSTITLKDLKTPSPLSSANSVHHHQSQTNAIETVVDVATTNATASPDVNDENAPSNFTIENAVNSSDKVIYETPYERPLASSIPASSPTHHVSTLTPPPPQQPMPPTSKMETDDYSTHKSIHHTMTTTHYDMMVDENLENKQQNFVDEEDVWRPW